MEQGHTRYGCAKVPPRFVAGYRVLKVVCGERTGAACLSPCTCDGFRACTERNRDMSMSPDLPGCVSVQHQVRAGVERAGGRAAGWVRQCRQRRERPTIAASDCAALRLRA